jgi:glycogen synthase
MAAGAPVIGLGQGGLLDTVRCISSGCDQPTGLMFAEQHVDALVFALQRFEQEQLWRRMPSEQLRRWAEQFSPTHFQARMADQLDRAWQRHQQRLRRRQCGLSVPLG